MKAFQKAVLALSVVSVMAQARSLDPNTFPKEAAPVLRPIKVAEVAREGIILRERRNHPYTEFLIGLPVAISTGDACTKFVGQVTTKPDANVIQISPQGASDPLTEACIAVMPQPVHTNLTLSMKVLTGGFVPAARFHTQLVMLQGRSIYKVTLDLQENKVTIVYGGPQPR